MEQQQPPRELDFDKIESLRRHMLLTVGNMADFLDISRQTWYSWLRGKEYPRKKKEQEVKVQVKKLLYVLSQRGWPQPDVIASSQRERYEKLLAMFEQ